VRSAVDIGCGCGAGLHALEERDVADIVGYHGDYVGWSILLIDPGKFKPVDLRNDFVVFGKFDLAISLEVAEHLPGEFAQPLIDVWSRPRPLSCFPPPSLVRAASTT
jgi:hypothetical protein